MLLVSSLKSSNLPVGIEKHSSKADSIRHNIYMYSILGDRT